MGAYQKYLDDATEQNIKTIARSAQTGSKINQVANAHTQSSKIDGIDLKADSSKDAAS